jgi:hypothetical protein
VLKIKIVLSGSSSLPSFVTYVDATRTVTIKSTSILDIGNSLMNVIISDGAASSNFTFNIIIFSDPPKL